VGARQGHRLRALPLGRKTAQALDRYLRIREEYRLAFATSWLAEGGNENELMLVAGWKSRMMIDRYTKATAAERARATHARLSPADRL